MIFKQFEKQIYKHTQLQCKQFSDPAHDFIHVKRVVAQAEKLAIAESADINVTQPAAYLHDIVYICKTDPRRSQASTISADAAIEFLKKINYPQKYYENIHHAICAHSYSANIKPLTLEAQIVQDADRLDGLGAIGIARCFALGGKLGRILYSDNDISCTERAPEDAKYTLDHFYEKLFKMASLLQTTSGQKEGRIRTEYLANFVEQLKTEIFNDMNKHK